MGRKSKFEGEQAVLYHSFSQFMGGVGRRGGTKRKSKVNKLKAGV